MATKKNKVNGDMSAVREALKTALPLTLASVAVQAMQAHGLLPSTKDEPSETRTPRPRVGPSRATADVAMRRLGELAATIDDIRSESRYDPDETLATAASVIREIERMLNDDEATTLIESRMQTFLANGLTRAPNILLRTLPQSDRRRLVELLVDEHTRLPRFEHDGPSVERYLHCRLDAPVAITLRTIIADAPELEVASSMEVMDLSFTVDAHGRRALAELMQRAEGDDAATQAVMMEPTKVHEELEERIARAREQRTVPYPHNLVGKRVREGRGGPNSIRGECSHADDYNVWVDGNRFDATWTNNTPRFEVDDGERAQ